MTLRVIITTYNRPTMCEELVAQIRSQYTGAEVWVYNDGGVPPKLYRAKLYNEPHKGRLFYWALWRKIFSDLKRAQGFKYVLFLPDDVTLVDGAIQEMIKTYKAIEDDNKISLNPIVDRRGRGPCWVPVDPVCIHGAWRTQWFDCCGLVEWRFFDALNWHIAKVPQAHFDNNESSGVGSQITKRLDNLGLSMYQTNESLVLHGDHESKMHFEERRRNPL